MILGFAFQVSALHFGALALFQPILALELLFVFAYMAILGSRRVQLRDWLAASAMSAGLALFLLAAAPSRGQPPRAGLVALGTRDWQLAPWYLSSPGCGLRAGHTSRRSGAPAERRCWGRPRGIAGDSWPR